MPDSTYADGCPECLYRNNLPTRTEPVPNGVQCHYRCANCDGKWQTSYWTFDRKEA